MSSTGAFSALILAGTRSGGDPLARALGVSHKAAVPVGGVPMLARVVAALDGAHSVRRIAITGMDRASAAAVAEIAPLVDSGKITLLAGRATPSASVLEALETLPDAVPLLVTTADHPLLSPATVDEFAAASVAGTDDVTVGLTDAEAVRAAFPDARRTVLRLRGGAYCGCNLFAFLTADGKRAPAFWAAIEQHRKRPWRMLLPIGIVEVLRFALGRLSLEDVVGLASRKMGVRVRAVILSRPEAGFDVDKLEHLQAAERFLRDRS